MSGKELNGIPDQAASDQTTKEDEMLQLLAPNNLRILESKCLDPGTNGKQPQIVEQAESSGVTGKQPQIVEQAGSSGVTGKQPQIVEQAVSNGTTTTVLGTGSNFPNGSEGLQGDVGMMAMLNALRAGHLKRLEQFFLWEVSSYSQITTAEEGTDTIAAALMAGNLPNLHTLDLTGSLPKLIPARKLSKVIREMAFGCSCGTGRLLEGYQICMGCMFCNTHPGKNQALECLRCSCGRLQEYSGNDGIEKIGRALNKTPIHTLRVLRLQHNYIGDKGASSLAKILRRGKLPHLDELDLEHNPVGCNGAMKIVFAYLKNPLLTVRVNLDWPNFLLHEKAVGFRDSNVRLEHRLRNGEIPRDSIVINQHIDFEYYLKRHPRSGCFQRHSHRLHLLCQAHSVVSSRCFTSHEVLSEGAALGTQPKGIEIRNRSMVGDHSSSHRQNVQRDLDLDTEDEVAKVDGWLSSGDESEDGSPVKRRTGVNRIYITSKSCGFFSAAEALGNQLEGPDSEQNRASLPMWIGRTFRRRYWPWQSKAKTEQVMDSIKAELLMMAERKPDEFYGMFGLRQVLLQNPSFENKYSRVWLCKSCFLWYSDFHKVHSITEIEPKSSQ
ncbi:unnamed protein product [Calypogeia fissa]